MILEHRFAHIPQDARRGRAWIASLAPLFTASLAPDEAVPIDAFLRYQHLGSCVLAADKGPAQVLQRTPEQARVQALDHLVLWTPLHGRARRVDGDQVDSVGPGEILVLDLSHPVQIEMEALAARALLVPHRLVDDGREPPDRYGALTCAVIVTWTPWSPVISAGSATACQISPPPRSKPSLRPR